MNFWDYYQKENFGMKHTHFTWASKIIIIFNIQMQNYCTSDVSMI